MVGQAPGAVGHDGFILDREVLSDRLTAVTEREEGVDKQTELQLLEIDDDLQGESREFPNFSVEMETGTGKTYVYINTALQLAQTHGLRNFVILVHSVAIRAGVVKTFEQTEEHFRAKFPSLPYKWGVLGEGPELDDFLEPSSTVQFLVASVQAIDKPDTGVVYGVPEQPQLWGESASGMNSIAATHPVVIVDEPQNFKTQLRKRAMATLNPLFVLRYSATHAEKFNLVHLLGPKTATEQGLVKRVSVKGIAPGASGQAYLRVDKIRTKGRRLFAEVMIDVASANEPKRTEVVLQTGDDLFEVSGNLASYRGAAGGGTGPEPDDEDNTVTIRRRKDKFESPEFKALWGRIRYKARYRITLDSSVLPGVVAVSEHLEEIKYLAKRTNLVQSAELRDDDAGKVITSDTEIAESAGMSITIVGQRLPDLVRLVEDQLLATKFPLQLTRPTVAAIIAAVPGNLQARAIDDPERWARIVASAIRAVTIEEMVKRIGYEPDPEDDWWDAEVIFVESEDQNPPRAHAGVDPKNGVLASPVGGANFYDHVIYDSHVERESSPPCWRTTTST